MPSTLNEFLEKALKAPKIDEAIAPTKLYGELKETLEDTFRAYGYGVHLPTFSKKIKKLKTLFDQYYKEIEILEKETIKKQK
jgi:N-acetyl-anhydromuramyl-L-alanine amidase AmpD